MKAYINSTFCSGTLLDMTMVSMSRDRLGSVFIHIKGNISPQTDADLIY